MTDKTVEATDTSIDWEKWALDMCDLLDRIDVYGDNEDKRRQLCKERFDIARKHGMTVEGIRLLVRET